MSDWFFSEEGAQLIRPERSVQLTAKAAAVLACLQRHAGEIVSPEVFFDEVWPDAHVTPDLIREYIHDIRDALGDDARKPRYVETIRGKGFRLIGNIESGIEAARGAAVGLEHRESLPTLALLEPPPTGDNALDTIGKEVVSEVTNHLARFHYIGLIARRSLFHAAETSDIRAFAGDVRAKYLLESNFSRLGGQVRARVQMLDASSGHALWGSRVDLDRDDLSIVVDEVSNEIVMALTGWHGELHRAEYKSARRKPVETLTAFDHFILGCDLEMRLDRDSLAKSMAHLERSLQLDPTFARAWLVHALLLRWAFAVLPGRDRAYLQKSAKAFQAAFNLAPTDPVNLALMAMNTARVGNLEGAIVMLQRAEATMSGDSDAIVCVATAKSVLTEDIETARAMFDNVMQRNRATPSWVYFADACVAFMAGDFSRCVASFRSAPPELSATVFCCLSLVMLERNKEALRLRARLQSNSPTFDFEKFAENFPIANPSRRSEFDTAVQRLRGLS